jgi:hypothetical protein
MNSPTGWRIEYRRTVIQSRCFVVKIAKKRRSKSERREIIPGLKAISESRTESFQYRNR